VLKVLFETKRLRRSAIEELPIFAMIPQAWMVILLVSVGGVMNPPQSSSMVTPFNSTDRRVCCDLLCSGELQNLLSPSPLIIANARALFFFI
jgi:hypothetical protein